MTTAWMLPLVVHVMLGDAALIISAQWNQKQKEKYMKTGQLVQRPQKNRPMTMVNIRIPDGVIEDLKRGAPMHFFRIASL